MHNDSQTQLQLIQNWRTKRGDSVVKLNQEPGGLKWRIKGENGPTLVVICFHCCYFTVNIVCKQKRNDNLYCEHETRISAVETFLRTHLTILAILSRKTRGLMPPKAVERMTWGLCSFPTPLSLHQWVTVGA